MAKVVNPILCLLTAVATLQPSFSQAENRGPGNSVRGHTVGQPTAFQYPWLWANDSLQDFALSPAAQGLTLLPESDPQVTWLQARVNTVDSRLREKFPALLKNTPRPQIVISQSDDANAFAHAGPRLCFEIPVKHSRQGRRDLEVVALTAEGTVALGDAKNCHKNQASLPEVVAFFNAGSPFCKLSLQGDQELVLGEKCLYHPVLAVGSARAISFPTTSSVIELKGGLLRTLQNQEQLLAAVFHELGHFYRSHLATPYGYFNFFYSIEKASAGKRPLPAPEFLRLTDSVRSKLQGALVNKFQPTFTSENAIAKQEKLGFYTIEQEADELSLELLSYVGIDPHVAIEALLTLGRVWEQTALPGNGALSVGECSRIMSKGWKDAQGNPASIPLGDLKDLHHSPCFRAYNIWTEIQAHAL